MRAATVGDTADRPYDLDSLVWNQEYTANSQVVTIVETLLSYHRPGYSCWLLQQEGDQVKLLVPQTNDC
jgi:hypothetical protein